MEVFIGAIILIISVETSKLGITCSRRCGTNIGYGTHYTAGVECSSGKDGRIKEEERAKGRRLTRIECLQDGEC